MSRSKNKQSCPRCGSKDVLLQEAFGRKAQSYVCLDCDQQFETGGYRPKHREDQRGMRRRDTEMHRPDQLD